MFCIASTVFAQTATPHPNALPVGIYQFEDLSSPEIELSGPGWSLGSTNPIDYLQNTNASDEMVFYVTDLSAYLLINNSSNVANSDFRVCVDAVCEDFVSEDDGWYTQGVNLSGTNSQITIINLDGVRNRFDYMIVGATGAVASTVSGTYPTATPNPAYIYGTISGVSGTVTTRFDMTITAGEVAISSALLFLFFSAVVFVICLMVFSHVRK